MKWTKAQQATIDSRDQSLLVTAAAGSGKTAVLVERIIKRLVSKDDPWDIDQFLVVTFTRAAAKEMKERIYSSLDAELRRNPSDRRLGRMREKVYSSDIRTIDSFCKNVVSEYFTRIDLDPDFRFMDQGEGELLKHQVIEEMMREEYAAADQTFLELSDMFSSKGSDDALCEIILGIYDMAQAHAWPDRFYSSLSDSIREVDLSTISECGWMKELVKWIRDFAEETLTVVEKLTRIAQAENDDGLFDTIIGNLSSDRSFFTRLMEAESFQDIHYLCDTYKFPPVGKAQVRKGTEDQKLIADEMKGVRDEYRDFFNKKIKERFLDVPLELIVSDENRKIPYLKKIIELTARFDETFLSEKKDRKSFEFSDIEHFAVRILINDDGSITDAARDYRRRYREVMVDEYQDTNELNEMILSAVTRDGLDYFMVGDVKQSIYGFRNADPGIIIRKSKEFKREEDSDFRRIDLDKNFRSRATVVDTVNDIFRMVMIEEIGGVEYEKKAWLKLGADYYPPLPDGQDNSTETVILARDDEELDEISDDQTSLEATWTAQRISSLMKDFKVADGNGSMRPIDYSDIAVIMRSTKVNAAKIMDVFNAYGIPAENAAATGYFKAAEVVVTLNYLRIIDNPRQDIPLASVLTSMYVGLSDEDMALIRAAHKELSFYQALLAECSEPKAELSPDARKRLDDFWNELTSLRHLTCDTPVYQIIARLYQDTGYDALVSCLPGGERRRENLMKLFDKAVAFSTTSFSGISSFVSYIEKLNEYKSDEGEADAGGSEDAVRIMTIHKSKGLEFPVVFVIGLGNRFHNSLDPVELDGDQDISMPYIDVAAHKKRETAHLAMLRSKKADRELGESIRVLYVALTRAKEKLILVGSLTEKDKEDYLKKGEELHSDRCTYSELKGSMNYYRVIIPVLKKAGYRIDAPDASGFAANEISSMKEKDRIRDLLCSDVSEDIRDKAIRLYDRFTSPYAFEKEVIPKQKYSVSEIKRISDQSMADDDSAAMFEASPGDDKEEEEFTPTLPLFLRQDQNEMDSMTRGVFRGTAMHRFLEKMDFSIEPLSESFDKQMAYMLERGFLTSDQSEVLSRSGLERFLSSELAARMQQAYKRGELYREQAFVTGDTPGFFFGDLSEDTDGADTEDQIIIQGIIDAFFVENGKIVLLDYKTDRVRSASMLTEKYTKQLQLYQVAVERAMDMPVSQLYLYSFALGKQIALPRVKSLLGKEKKE